MSDGVFATNWNDEWGIDPTGRVERHLRLAAAQWLRQNEPPDSYATSRLVFLQAAEALFWQTAGPPGTPIKPEAEIRSLTVGSFPPDGPVVYRHLSGSTLLYVGFTRQYLIRQKSHRNTAGWWSEVTTITTETHDSVETALTSEAIAITNEVPLYNRNRPKP